MHNRACFWKQFASERVNKYQKLLKSAEKYFYLTFSSFWAILIYKKVFLIRSETLGPLDYTLTANYEYSCSNRENWPLPIQIKLSKKPSTFCCNFWCSFGIYIKFSMFWKINEPHRSSISKFFWLRKMYFFKPFHNPDTNWVTKSYFIWDLRF